MKTILTFFFVLSFFLELYSQTQLDIRGNPLSNDTLVKLIVNYTGIENVVGLYSYSNSQPGVGVGGSFFGGNYGIIAKSTQGRGILGTSETNDGIRGYSDEDDGVWGSSTSGIGIKGSSTSGYGVRASSTHSYALFAFSSNSHGAWVRGDLNGESADLVLGGTDFIAGDDDGVIMSDPTMEHSDIILVTNDALVVKLDADTTSAGSFEIWNDINYKVFEVFENGTVKVDGSTVHSSDRNRKENIVEVTYSEILENLSEMAIYEWEYKGQNRRHIGPMAQDFQKAFLLGNDDKTIAVVDADGVALAAIKALQKEIELLKLEIEKLRNPSSTEKL